MDAGYDSKKIQSTILSKGWDLLMAIGKSRNVFIGHQHPKYFDSKESEVGGEYAFRRFIRRAEKLTCRLPQLQGQRKMKVFSVKRLHGCLKGIRNHEMLILSSKKTGKKKSSTSSVRKQTSLHGRSFKHLQSDFILSNFIRK